MSTLTIGFDEIAANRARPAISPSAPAGPGGRSRAAAQHYRPVRAVPPPSLAPTARRTPQACVAEANQSAASMRLTDRGIAAVMVVGLMIMVTAHGGDRADSTARHWFWLCAFRAEPAGWPLSSGRALVDYLVPGASMTIVFISLSAKVCFFSSQQWPEVAHVGEAVEDVHEIAQKGVERSDRLAGRPRSRA